MGTSMSSAFTRRPPTSEEHTRVTAIHSDDGWKEVFNSSKDSSKLMVIDFAASWCGPCRMMEPIINSMAEKYTDVQFARIDVDVLPDVAREFGVEAMPTFVLMKNGKEVDRIVGAKKDQLEKSIVKHRPLTSAA